MAQPVGWDQASKGAAAGEPGLVGAEQQAPGGRVDAVGTHQDIELDTLTVREPRLHPMLHVLKPNETVSAVQALLREGTGQRRQQVRTMNLIVRVPKRRLQGLGQWSAQQRAAVVPTALMPRQGLHADPPQFLGQAQPVQNPRRVRADLHPGAHLTERWRLFEDVDIKACGQQRQRCTHPADPSAHHPDRQSLMLRCTHAPIMVRPGSMTAPSTGTGTHAQADTELATQSQL